MKSKVLFLIPILLSILFIPSVKSVLTPLSLVNTCTAENHTGTTNINCVLPTTAGNVIIATGSVRGTNAACAGNPILGINAFSFDSGDLYANWHGANKLSTEIYDSGFLTSSGNLQVTLSGACFMDFSSLIVYQFKGVTSIALPATVNECNAQVTSLTSISCSLKALNGYGWIVGHVTADCTSCSYTNQENTIFQSSGTDFYDYTGVIKTVTANTQNIYKMTNSVALSGSVVALSILGNPDIPTSSTGGLVPTIPILVAIIIIVAGFVPIAILAMKINHGEADTSDINSLVIIIIIAGLTFVIGVAFITSIATNAGAFP